MALWGNCFGSTECPLSLNNHRSTFFSINRTQFIVCAFREWELLLSYGCRKISGNGQNGHIQIFREPSNQINMSIWTANCYGYIFHYMDKTLEHRNVALTYFLNVLCLSQNCSQISQNVTAQYKMIPPTAGPRQVRWQRDGVSHGGRFPREHSTWT